MNTQIIYYSKYGSTKEIAQAIGKKLGTENISDVRDVKEIKADLLIIGSPIYAEVPYKGIVRLLQDKPGRLQGKKVALFVVCLAKDYRKVKEREIGGPAYLKQLEKHLARAPLATQIFGGRMIVAELEEQERKRTEMFYKKRGVKFEDKDIMSAREVDEFVKAITAALSR
jgi:menaquinone-dependent protoporphyrinogen IX oxidase